MPTEFRYEVFLSHNSKDKPRARRLEERLKAASMQMEAGLWLWLDEWAIRAGNIFALKVDEGLEKSRVLMMCISSAVLASGRVALEGSTAEWRNKPN